MKTIEQLLAEHPLLGSLEPAHRALVAGCASNAGFQAGETIFREGEPAETFYLVRRGRVAIETFVPGRGPVTIETVSDGEALGWSWLLPPYRWHFDARAVKVTRMIAFDGTCLRGKCDADAALGYALLQRFAQVMVDRLQATRLRLLDLYGHEAAS